MAQLGKRHRCSDCEGVVLVTHPGSGWPECCGKPMEVVQPESLPSSD